jgi:hypothetical protein
MYGPFDIVPTENNSSRASPRAEKQNVDVYIRYVLQSEALFGNAGLTIDGEREVPKFVVALKCAVVGCALRAQAVTRPS